MCGGLRLKGINPRFIGAFGPSACIASALTIPAAMNDPAGGHRSETS